jgi:ubiquinone/menaquinone biosynthesis C-methylase UbiE
MPERPSHSLCGRACAERLLGRREIAMDDTQIAPVSRSKDAARKTYDALSRWYDLLSGGAERRCLALALEQLRAQPGECVLEIGPGTGHGLVALGEAVRPTGRAYGLDLSSGMLAVARARVSKAGVSPWVTLICGDGAALPLGPGCVDAIVMSFTLELFDTPEIAIVLEECRRALKPGGRLAVVAMATADRPTLMSRLYAWTHRRWPHLVDCRPIPLERVLEASGYSVSFRYRTQIWGLPVSIVIARPPGPGIASASHSMQHRERRHGGNHAQDHSRTSRAL